MQRIQIAFLFFAFFLIPSFAQAQTQTVRGVVRDQDAQMTLPGVNVIVVGSEPMLGASTDVDGRFKITNVPLGRITLRISAVGYEERVIPNILVEAGKETVLDVDVVESFFETEAIEIVANDNKNQPLNEMAVLSAQTFSVEETQRYAGALNDPSRMASAFAGVSGDPSGQNDIVVRGNSPRGVLWRLEGVPAPNPNHFAGEGATGGPVNALNAGMLANSDFFAGAFAPEYGNALSGVFDVQFRNGNNEKHEQRFSLGALGTDITLEGPFKKGGRGSYLINYRYSSLALLDGLGVLDFGGVPKYQDASFKIRVPAGEKGMFTLFGLGGTSGILQKETDEEDEDFIYGKIDANARLGITGLKYLHFFGDNTFLESYVAASHSQNGSENRLRDLESDQERFFMGAEDLSSRNEIQFGTLLNHKINRRHRLQFGGRLALLSYDAQLTEDLLNSGTPESVLDAEGNSQLAEAYTSWKWRISPTLTAVSGLHFTHFALNENTVVEPRLALSWEASARSRFSVGAGLHSRLENLSTYLAPFHAEGENVTEFRNENLGLSRAAHFVLGYDLQISEQTRLKAEAYYQHLFQIPVANDAANPYSVLNSSEGYITEELVNEGLGRNYGVELTLERSFDRGFYYNFTSSIFNSEYKALDNVWRDTRFNSNYVLNAVAGKEFTFGKKQNRSLGVNLRATLMGGQRYTPYDRETTLANNYGTLQEDAYFTLRGDDIFFLNLGLNYRVNRKRTTHEFQLEVQNLTNQQGVVGEYYSFVKRDFQQLYQLSMIPNFNYIIKF